MWGHEGSSLKRPKAGPGGQAQDPGFWDCGFLLGRESSRILGAVSTHPMQPATRASALDLDSGAAVLMCVLISSANE